MRGLGFMLDQCRQYRIAADYRIDEDFERNAAQAALDTSRDILRGADALD